MEKAKAPGYFMAVAIILLIWDLIGVAAFAMDLMMTEEMIAMMPPEQQEMYLNTPGWTKIAYGVATIGAALGCIGLLMKKAWSKLLFIISLIGVVVQFGYTFIGMGALDIVGPSALIMPIVIFVIGAYQIFLSNKGQKEGWLI
tara:strand:+ start:743 stop:1171 length:429 start_codon:yes stop_codon:yes gene_type:complete